MRIFPHFFFNGKIPPSANILLEVVMKKIFIAFALMLFMVCFSSLEIRAASGHQGFPEIIITGNGKLLENMTDEEIAAGYNALGRRKLFGWKHYYFNQGVDATYRGEIIFAKVNRTAYPLEINYVLQEKEYSENSWKVKGSISGKIQGKIKKSDLALNVEGEAEKKDTESFTRFEETKFKVLVEPNHRIVLQITGECTVTNGVSKHYIFGIVSKKGAWELVEVVTRYYELRTSEIEE